ncbi:MAG: transporter [Labilithrix sp.]|nr:transporter [Labilithrix sp.]
MSAVRSSPLAYPAFLALWLAGIVTFLGTFVQSIGEAWLMMDLTQGAMPVAALGAAFVGSSLVAMLPGGILADRYDRRRVAILSQIIQAIAALTMSVLAFTHHVTPAVLVGGVIMIGIGAALGSPAWAALVPEILPLDLVAEGVALNSVAYNLARALGPAIGGVVLARFGAPTSFAINAASFVVVMIALAMFRSHTGPQRAPSIRPLASTFAEPWAFVVAPGDVRRVFGAMMGFTFGAGVFYALTPSFGKDTLGASAFAYGVMIGAMGAGAVAGASIVKRLRRRFSPRGIVTGTMVTFAVSIALVSRATSIELAMVLLLPAGVGWLGTFSSLQALVQLWAPDRLRARTIALYQMLHLAMWAVASIVGGLVADRVGVRGAMLLGAAVCLASAISTWRQGLPRDFAGLRELG